MRFAVVLLLFCASCISCSAADTPAYAITPTHSSIKFSVKASVALVGKFDAWIATLTFSSPDVITGVLEVTIQAEAWIPEAA
jgi:polyisoprenoid-binding protein YceI